MIDARELFSGAELAGLRQQVVALWTECMGLPKSEIAFRLNLSIDQLEYIFAAQLDHAPCKDAGAFISMYYRARSGDGDMLLLILAATMWDQSPFAEMLMMPEGVHWS